MTTRISWHVALLLTLLGDEEPLVGDLLEESHRRSNFWLLRQVMFAVFARTLSGASATLREPQRLTGALGDVAMFLILGFQVAVAGSLLGDLLQPVGQREAPGIGHPPSLWFVILLSLVVSWLVGRALGSLHRRSRIATVLVCGLSAAASGAVTVSVVAPTGSVFPSAVHQTAAGMIFVFGLFVGSLRCPPLDRQASSAISVFATDLPRRPHEN